MKKAKGTFITYTRKDEDSDEHEHGLENVEDILDAPLDEE